MSEDPPARIYIYIFISTSVPNLTNTTTTSILPRSTTDSSSYTTTPALSHPPHITHLLSHHCAMLSLLLLLLVSEGGLNFQHQKKALKTTKKSKKDTKKDTIKEKTQTSADFRRNTPIIQILGISQNLSKVWLLLLGETLIRWACILLH